VVCLHITETRVERSVYACLIGTQNHDFVMNAVKADVIAFYIVLPTIHIWQSTEMALNTRSDRRAHTADVSLPKPMS
jgi:hypothetical protein